MFAWTQTRLLLPTWLGTGEALSETIEKGDRELLRTTWRDWVDGARRGTTPADLVVLPRTTAEVSQVLKISREHRVPVTPCGARISISTLSEVKS